MPNAVLRWNGRPPEKNTSFIGTFVETHSALAERAVIRLAGEGRREALVYVPLEIANALSEAARSLKTTERLKVGVFNAPNSQLFLDAAAEGAHVEAAVEVKVEKGKWELKEPVELCRIKLEKEKRIGNEVYLRLKRKGGSFEGYTGIIVHTALDLGKPVWSMSFSSAVVKENLGKSAYDCAYSVAKEPIGLIIDEPHIPFLRMYSDMKKEDPKLPFRLFSSLSVQVPQTPLLGEGTLFLLGDDALPESSYGKSDEKFSYYSGTMRANLLLGEYAQIFLNAEKALKDERKGHFADHVVSEQKMNPLFNALSERGLTHTDLKGRLLTYFLHTAGVMTAVSGKKLINDERRLSWRIGEELERMLEEEKEENTLFYAVDEEIAGRYELSR
ncbi:hypothetical protein B9Q03_08665 [Candidatus Marsarchaeota G2 archaeon OSP_D]|jgi:hypothetical protein|uniref:Uncharacterized protein n=1 Tax=Candidatus Marsarchaeota G2 archaeon OSP_D TaxID=1978157 RepID=A0A2R6AS84_9ARCH|nr:MAG: hypothetical protein B9Q03_08665 [Candidatus Marsarchaeota G2 archaeon OSP_D]